jgi:hypothetical protein
MSLLVITGYITISYLYYLLLVVNNYSIDGYWCLFNWCLLVPIVLVPIYFIDAY